ncbi:chromosome segregation protein SMC [Lacticaseibacillus thailandensis]|uniref:chromosome segregation protein SMC n=1 Tax=Lacticaseibacillus thailandensis TaxID=381741 RepID=UPI000B018990|nr:chromosome segregation protein SMC [Lacticaseibacillus thailandensis]
MYLQELTINGFKSFADKTQIKFDPGLTGVVGPNGSGKSNITEAIRWVLGEQSAKSLRGERMGDVIFAGTDTRPALNRAEVTMVFNNDDGYLEQQPSQVSVTRRLFRNGDSEFLLNNQQVRLKDIVTLFMDSGLGRDSFAFISQGRVEAIFNSKPEDRRGIFEEAAGVLKYKNQKAKAQAQLDETDDNLDRVHDIVHELAVRLEPLAEQSSMAREYQRQSTEYAQLHQQLLARQVQSMVAQQREVQTAAKATKRRIEELNGKIKGLEADSDRRTKAAADLDHQLAQVNDDLLAKSMKQQSLNGEEDVSNERVQNATSRLADLRERLAQAQADQQDAQQHLQDVKQQQDELAQAIKTTRAQLRTVEQAASTPAELNAQLETTQQNYIDTLQQQANNRNAIAALSKEAQLAASQQAATQSRLAELNAQIKQLTAKQETADAALKAAQAEQNQATAAVRAAETALSDDQEQYQRLNQQLMEHSQAYTQASARYKTLKELNDDYAGFYSGVRTVLKNKGKLPGVVGAVAELLKIPERYQVAFDQAIGGSLQAIVTANQGAAKRAISFLKQRRAGRATFLPADVIRPRSYRKVFAIRWLGNEVLLVWVSTWLASISI